MDLSAVAHLFNGPALSAHQDVFKQVAFLVTVSQILEFSHLHKTVLCFLPKNAAGDNFYGLR